MSDAEKKIIKIQVTKSRIFDNAGESATYLSINAFCKHGSCPTKYKIMLKEKPKTETQIEFDVTKSIEHDSEQHKISKKVRVLGEARDELARSVIIENKGSAKD